MYEEKQEMLNKARIQLKKDFCGLDDIIDKTISTISSWFIMPELQSRPLIINLWGLTGVGKTALIRKLVEYIDFDQKFLEIHIPTQLTENNSLSYQLADCGVLENSPGIILLDEFQGFRSIDQQGQHKEPKALQDIWQLLSDGKISNKADFLRDLTDLYVSFRRRHKQKTKVEESTDEIYPELGINNDIYHLDKLRFLLGLPFPVSEMINWDNDKILDIIEYAFTNAKDYHKYSDFTQTIIFICGNLDDAYTISNAITEVDLDPDVFYEMTKDINILDIKKSLQKMFKPEQISRLGNIHIIYPSFNKETYECIIRKQLDHISSNIKSHKIVFDDSIIDFVFKNGVFPAQGTRPVYSTIAYCIECNLPRIIMENFNEKEITVSIKESKINDIPISSDIQMIRDKLNIEDVKCIAAHEAGHVIASVYFKKQIPKIATARAISASAGYVIGDNCSCKNMTKTKLINEMRVCLAGRVAEEIIFKEDISVGASEDLGRATEIGLDMIRIYGMSGYIGWVNDKNIINSDDQNKGQYQTTDMPFNVEYLLKQEADTVRNLINSKQREFKQLIKLLIKKDIVVKDDIESIVGIPECEINTKVDDYLRDY